MLISKTQKDLKPTLMEPEKTGLKDPFYLIKTDGQIIFVVSPGLNGSEYNKTTVFLNNFQGIQVCQCLYGQGMILMQRMDGEGQAKEFKVLSLPPGVQVTIPVGWLGCLVNIGKTYLVVLNNIDIESTFLESSEVLNKKGLAYYIVEKKGEITFEANPNYSVHPQISME